ncbi:SagB/ThcOx family dehydrogenase [Methanospirillum stamsii]|uniref:Nitroreductase n=1 Tax=Methanospirillum stamsii TaxID=1277351 RepID=A0A2V2NG17_9EURY|nr:SagB/ThcOx family dehydrogenase [Methanospirillum stamsii]PWR75318.1 nitroreductase [Methanospirillum stamsii]
MQSDSARTGYRFLKETILQETSSLQSQEPTTKVCGVCEPFQKIITLPSPADIPKDPVLLWDTLDERQSIRDYSDEELQKWELSLLVHYTQGVREKKNASHLRTVPSAGALHPFETRIVINRVSGFDPGIYRYLPLDHALVKEVCHSGDHESVAKTCKRPGLVSESAVTFIWTAVPERMIWKFGSRGWRYLFIEAGHICQNLYIVAAGLNLGTCAIGSYNENDLNCILGIDGESEFCIYLASVGKKKA